MLHRPRLTALALALSASHIFAGPAPVATHPAARRPWQINALAAGGVEILIYDEIDPFWGIGAEAFRNELNAYPRGTAIALRINSPGGDVFEGFAIYNALAERREDVTAYVDGIAASMASIVMLSAKRVVIAANAMVMIHDPSGGAYGTAVDLRKQADLIDQVGGNLVDTYVKRTGKTTEEVAAAMAEETWFTAAEAVAWGLADEVGAEATIEARFDLSRFRSFNQQRPRLAALHKPHEDDDMSIAAGPKPTPQPIPPNNDPATPPNPQAQTPEQIRAAALAAETERRTAVRAVFQPFADSEGVDALLNTVLDDHSVSASDASAKLLAHLGKINAGPLGGNRVQTIMDDTEKFAAGAALALSARAGLSAANDAQPDNELRGFSLFDIARQCLVLNGIRPTGDRMEIIGAAFTMRALKGSHSTSDFPAILSNIARKAMLKGAEEAEETFQLWTTPGTLSDFKVNDRVDLNSFPSLDKVPEGGEYRNATIGERNEQIQLATYGKMFPITRQAIINDDLSMFSTMPRRMGRGALRTIGNLVYAILNGNPVMKDNVALFHGDHANLLTAAAPSTDAVDKARVAMGLQKDSTAEGAAGLNIRLAHILCPLALEGVFNVIRESQYEVDPAAKNATRPNSVRNTFDVISDARLDAASATNWYGAANASVHDTIEVGYLNGQQMPTLELTNGWRIDGAEFKVRMDATAKALDWRTLIKNPYAG